MRWILSLVIAALILGIAATAIFHVRPTPSPDRPEDSQTVSSFPARSHTPQTEAEWKAVLTPAQFYILREGGTETPFTSPLLHEARKGTYIGADCGEPLFRSEQKFDSGTGWPSFWAPITSGAIVLKEDDTLGMQRTEVLTTCGGHLGHVFDDGPPPTGLRYCMNGDALLFVPDAGQ